VALSDRGYLRLNPESGKVKEREFVTIVQHPDGLPMRIALRENEVTRARDDEEMVWYQADTAHGSSGAPVFNDSFQVAALHSSGRIKRNSQGEFALVNGGWVASVDGLRESDVIWEANVGFRVSRICQQVLAKAAARSASHARTLEAAMAGGDVLAAAVDRVSEPDRTEREGLTDRRGGNNMHDTPRTFLPEAPEPGPSPTPYGVTVPLQLRISLEMPNQPSAGRITVGGNGHGAGALETEAFQMRIPVIYDGLDEREGFDPRFLAFSNDRKVPMPRLTAAGEKVAAPLLDGSGLELKYHKFSVWMHKERRLALLTASNVDWRSRKKVVDGKKTDRDTLAGFPPNNSFAEQWVNDARIAEEHQLPDVFYTEDRGAFDKGHLVRRDDVCWGTSFEDIQMGNGDTYHVTNCSPQTKPFNQGQHGEENWGDLESHVQRVTKEEAEKVVIYAGPIFSADDRWFRGKDNSGKARIQIPTKFWKIVVSKANNRPAAYGFVLEQDVRAITEEEFFVTEEWIGRMTRLSDLQKALRGWVSLEDLLPFDQFDDVHG
jgi:endonuclease G, mitochondrial